jgi:hypothetical protein
VTLPSTVLRLHTCLSDCAFLLCFVFLLACAFFRFPISVRTSFQRNTYASLAPRIVACCLDGYGSCYGYVYTNENPCKDTTRTSSHDWATTRCTIIFLKISPIYRPPLWSSGQSSWLQIQRFRVRFASLPDFLRSSGSGTESTQPHEDN